MSKNRTLALVLFTLISCGGGGGGGSNNTPVISQTPIAPTPPPSLSFDELKDQYEGYYEYQSQWGLNMINASSAYARGATGLGITIGITDSGLDDSHVEISAGRLSGDSALNYSNYTPNTRQKRHGTMVASVAAGKQDKSDITPMHGVAFEADVLFVAIQLAEPDPDYDPVDIGNDDGSGNVSGAPDFTGIDNFFSQLFEVYNDFDVDIVNNSYGYSGNIIDYTEAQVRYAFPNTIEEMSQIGTPDSEKTIYVWAAGNAGGYADQGVDYSSPELLAGMAHYIPEIQGHSIAVASVDENGQISDFSSRCGVAQDYCISAPGGRVTAAYPTSTSDTGIYIGNTNDDNYNNCIVDNSCYAVTSGTSFAAPFVSGGLAVIADHFDGQLGSHEIVSRLFSTANKKGIYSHAAIYGQGLMDLSAATDPVGQMAAVMSLSLSGPMVPALFTSIQQQAHPLGMLYLMELVINQLFSLMSLMHHSGVHWEALRRIIEIKLLIWMDSMVCKDLSHIKYIQMIVNLKLEVLKHKTYLKNLSLPLIYLMLEQIKINLCLITIILIIHFLVMGSMAVGHWEFFKILI